MLAGLLCAAWPCSTAQAHSAGSVDVHGCHPDRNAGNYHCHRGPLSGYQFRSRGEMLEVLESGELPEPVEEKKGFFSSLFKRDSEEPPPPPPVASAEAPQDAPYATVRSGPARTVEERLRILKGLYEMELITEEEYAQRRRAILEEL